ncbi:MULTISPECIES: 3-deoxy-7-phosphoheptulonate synthase [unclassified Streptomyces]|uniref:3-deoxy-7-phosphoheptulonate synthase n=1 Tax=unclassified Streptomyces TaxID=2593676 RepID=UPI001661F63A|nr:MULTISPECIES: 3-deoxy-7-phosphoheptulonate synthase [unclassified Streptomyces]MBD0844695.1 3-deoxy-7-phosphoheptulonate synthase [Streptomyces sp. TRM68416]
MQWLTDSSPLSGEKQSAGKRAGHQPDWQNHADLAHIRSQLAARPGIVTAEDTAALRSLLVDVAAGAAHVIQAGDCAEDPDESTADYVARKSGLLDLLAATMQMNTHRPVVRVGRIGGQYAKPRSRPTETVGGRELPVYRGHMVNSPEPDPRLRQPDPWRMLDCYRAAAEVAGHLGWTGTDRHWSRAPRVFTSHEALVLDYETPLLRHDVDGRLYLASTHWPWVGERTRQPDGAHVALLASVANPVACKVGPGTTEDSLLHLCAVLDPHREPGRLTLISRMGAPAVADRLPPLVKAVHAAGHPVIWLSDPMHGNTVTTPAGLKTRHLDTVLWEAEHFQCAVRSAGGVAGGLHLEVTPDTVTECVGSADCEDRVAEKYTTLCDPRLNPEQAVSVATSWTA